jgi:hypothetical protein
MWNLKKYVVLTLRGVLEYSHNKESLVEKAV